MAVPGLMDSAIVPVLVVMGNRAVGDITTLRQKKRPAQSGAALPVCCRGLTAFAYAQVIRACYCNCLHCLMSITF